MAVVLDKTTLTLELPADVMERVCRAAAEAQYPVGREAVSLIDRGLNQKTRALRNIERTRRGYADYIASGGRRDQAFDEMMEHLNKIEQEIMNELHPN
jgi:hypothetical protein